MKSTAESVGADTHIHDCTAVVAVVFVKVELSSVVVSVVVLVSTGVGPTFLYSVSLPQPATVRTIKVIRTIAINLSFL